MLSAFKKHGKIANRGPKDGSAKGVRLVAVVDLQQTELGAKSPHIVSSEPRPNHQVVSLSSPCQGVVNIRMK